MPLAAAEYPQGAKRRVISPHQGKTRVYDTIRYKDGRPDAPQSSAKGEYKVAGIQYTESEGHPFLSSREKGMTDIGGEFFTTKRWVEGVSPRRVRYDWDPFGASYRHMEIDSPILSVDPDNTSHYNQTIPLYSNDVELDALGATAISRVKPTNPTVDLLAALTEIRNGGLPSLPGSQSNWASRAQAARDAGSEYLNVQFGWKPLINDVKGFASGVSRAHSVIEQYKRDIGKPIRRDYEFPMVSEVSETILGTNVRPYCLIVNQISSGGGVLTRRVEVTRRRWFSGCFTYYFPSEILGSKKLADLAILADQLGLEPSPEVLWQVSPWSWAVDWFSNTGDVISNWTSFHQDGLVMRYGYMMEHSIIRVTYTLNTATFAGGYVVTPNPISFLQETKVRRRANPYGFGVSWDGLNPFQGSILAALGISRGR
jgi:hypothetical protein